MDDANSGLRIALGVIGGVIIALVLVLVALMFTAGGGQDAFITDTTGTTATATTTAATTTTTAAAPTTTAPPVTTSSSAATTTTTTPAATTSSTVLTFAGDTSTKTAASTGTPGSALTDIRTGDHTVFTRVVFDFEGEGTPAYEVGYEPGPTFIGSGGGDPKSPAGAAFLVVRIFPGLTYDVDDFSQTYLGPTEFDPGLGPIVEIAFVDEFEADMMWVIGLTGERRFDVSTRVDPQRLVIDIEN